MNLKFRLLRYSYREAALTHPDEAANRDGIVKVSQFWGKCNETLPPKCDSILVLLTVPQRDKLPSLPIRTARDQFQCASCYAITNAVNSPFR